MGGGYFVVGFIIMHKEIYLLYIKRVLIWFISNSIPIFHF